jgi:site-specific recombinase XerD
MPFRCCLASRQGRDQGEKKAAGRKLSNLSFRLLRHSFNSELANAGVSQEIRRKLTGHSGVEMNRIYMHLELEPLRAAVEKLPTLGLRLETEREWKK